MFANIRAMGEVVQANSKDVFVSWLPLYHDMGLIGAWLGSLYYAALFVVMPPLSFLAHPERWLWAIHQYRGTLAASPNFGYEYCLHRVKAENIEGLDLSSWRAAFNGAEAVSPETLKQFILRFEQYGFRAQAMMPVYGLAESSVGLAFPPINRGPHVLSINRELYSKTGSASLSGSDDEAALKFPSSGFPIPGHQIRVTDQANHELPEWQEGKIQFHGPSSTSGYLRNASKTRELFVDEWLETGDLGFIAEGELYVTGRIKDIIIRAGRNIYPHELEEAVGNISGIRTGRVAVFGSEDRLSKTEKLVVLAETRVQASDELNQLRQSINNLSTDLTGSPPDDIVLAPPNTVLKTSSGKIRRAGSKALYESGQIGKSSPGVKRQIATLLISSLKPQFKRSVRYVKRFMYAIYCWAAYAFLAPIVWLTASISPSFKLRWAVMCGCARTLAKLTNTKLSVNGLENIQPGQSCIYVANHSSYLDSYSIVALLPGYFRFVAKAELAKYFITRKPLENIHTEFVERYDITKSVNDTSQLRKVLQKNESLIFFAEGTFSRIPGLMPFHLGAFTLAAEANVPVVPIAIRGTRSILRSDSWFPHHGSIHLEIGKAIHPEAFQETAANNNWDKAIELRNQSREFILRYCGEPDLS